MSKSAVTIDKLAFSSRSVSFLPAGSLKFTSNGTLSFGMPFSHSIEVKEAGTREGIMQQIQEKKQTLQELKDRQTKIDEKMEELTRQFNYINNGIDKTEEIISSYRT
eukprot:TRINITY_DN26750_c0_g1_i1.p1 TRINITY_DN26750_c0_g1~~TRINITY_DN26750_c0_g1_i1.p1  ORF type:complete len:107 (+),score=20.57 TRINITY_DN26750_c0_g1_i1:108-428(+)